MKVYKMNDCDWMAACSVDEAKNKYIEDCGCDEDFEIKECSLDDTMWYGFTFDELEEFFKKEKDVFEIRKDPRGDSPVVLKLKFSKVLELDDNDFPYMIASTEH